MAKKSPTEQVQYVPFPNNPRSISEQESAALAASLNEMGSLDGFVVNVSPGAYQFAIISGNQKHKYVDLNTAEKRISQRFKEPTSAGTVAVGFVIYNGESFPYREVYWSDYKCQVANIRANNLGGHNNPSLLELFPQEVLEASGINIEFEKGVEAMREQYFSLPAAHQTDDHETGDGPDDDDDEGGKFAAPKASDDEYSSFEIIMRHEDKTQLIETLNTVRSSKSLPNLAAALMYIVNHYDAQ